MPGNEMAFEVFKELARTRRRNADTVDPGIGRTRLGQRTLKCVFLIGTRSAHSIRASGLTAAQTGRTHDRTRPMLQQRQKVLAKAPPSRTRVQSIPSASLAWAPSMRRREFIALLGVTVVGPVPAFAQQLTGVRQVLCRCVETV